MNNIVMCIDSETPNDMYFRSVESYMPSQFRHSLESNVLFASVLIILRLFNDLVDSLLFKPVSINDHRFRSVSLAFR